MRTVALIVVGLLLYFVWNHFTVASFGISVGIDKVRVLYIENGETKDAYLRFDVRSGATIITPDSKISADRTIAFLDCNVENRGVRPFNYSRYQFPLKTILDENIMPSGKAQILNVRVDNHRQIVDGMMSADKKGHHLYGVTLTIQSTQSICSFSMQ